MPSLELGSLFHIARTGRRNKGWGVFHFITGHPVGNFLIIFYNMHNPPQWTPIGVIVIIKHYNFYLYIW